MREEYVLTIGSYFVYLSSWFFAYLFGSLVDWDFLIPVFISIQLISFLMMTSVVRNLYKKHIMKNNYLPLIFYILIIITLIFSFMMIYNSNNKSHGVDSFMDFAVDLSEPATASNRLTEVKDWSFKSGVMSSFAIGFFNTDYDCELKGAMVNFDCTFERVDGLPVTENDFKITQATTRVDVGESGKLDFRVQPSNNLVKDSYACEFLVTCADKLVEKKPVFITITS